MREDHESAPAQPEKGQAEAQNEQQEKAEKQPQQLSENEWRQLLDPERYRVLRQCGTEPPFRNRYWNEKTPGVYHCAACDAPLFSSKTKYESGSGWPSFYAQMETDNVGRREDRSHGMVRVEVYCKRCGGHLGHVFPDGPQPTGERFCINSAALELKPAEGEPDKK